MTGERDRPEQAAPDSEQMNIGALARAVGIPADTLRTWERRYGVPTPQRTPSGHRRYGRSAVQHLRLVRQALDLGHRASAVLAWPIEELRTIVADLRVQPATPPSAEEQQKSDDRLIEQAIDYVHRFDDERLDRFFAEHWARDSSLGFLTNIVVPFLEALGNAWEAGRISVSHEHHASERLRFFLESRWRELSIRASGPLVLCASPEGEQHVLGLHMATLMASIEGAQIVFLGASVPAVDIAEAVQQMNISGIMLSFSNCVAPRTATRTLKEIASLVPATPILVGGQGVPEELDGVSHSNGDFQAASKWLAQLEPRSRD